jgi:hypothetical protein
MELRIHSLHRPFTHVNDVEGASIFAASLFLIGLDVSAPVKQV